MSVRVVARIRPLLGKELDRDVIVTAAHGNDDGSSRANVVKIPNPKNESEEFSFAFNSVYDQPTAQEELFTAEVAPHLKALFQGLDVTIFAYGVTGTGKTHTMRGGLKLAERGVIPRLLSGVFRRGKKLERDSGGATAVVVSLSYYEIYNDKVYDLLEPPEGRTPAGLPLREKDGRTMVVGLSERRCGDLRDFERLYIEANHNRVTAATKLNAHSSRSHAILRVKVTQTTTESGSPVVVRESTASAIDLAGSEDNRRTDNGRERLVESAAINKSLFVLSQCIDAISRGDRRIPYRESKMTRILSLGQNNGVTVMILNLAPVRSYHLDTLSSLNVSSRAKRIEVREIENEVVFKQPPKSASSSSSLSSSSAGGATMQRQPLRPLANAHNTHNAQAGAALAAKAAEKAEKAEKPVKAFSVYADRSRAAPPPAAAPRRPTNPAKRPVEPLDGHQGGRATKIAKPASAGIAAARTQAAAAQAPSISAEQIEAMVEKKVSEILASRAAAAAEAAAAAPPTAADSASQDSAPNAVHSQISEEVRRRLEALERKIEDEDRDRSRESGRSDGRSDGLRLLLQARQAKERGDEAAALRAYEAALPFFPGQAKLLGKIDKLRARLAATESDGSCGAVATQPQHKSNSQGGKRKGRSPRRKDDEDEDGDDYQDGGDADVDDESFVDKPAQRGKGSKGRKGGARRDAGAGASSSSFHAVVDAEADGPPTPRAKQLLDIVNSRDLARIRSLHGFGAKKAQDLVGHLEGLRGAGDDGSEAEPGRVESLAQLRLVPGMGGRTVERAYEGLAIASEEWAF